MAQLTPPAATAIEAHREPANAVIDKNMIKTA